MSELHYHITDSDIKKFSMSGTLPETLENLALLINGIYFGFPNREIAKAFRAIFSKMVSVPDSPIWTESLLPSNYMAIATSSKLTDPRRWPGQDGGEATGHG